MKVLAIIPARGGSKGVVDKNIKLLAGKPLLDYTIESAQKARLISGIVVSTDSERIAAVASSAGLKPPFLRPQEFASDTAGSLGVVQHAIEYFEEHGEYFDAVCLLQPTTPFRKPGFIDDAIAKFIKSGADSLVSVLPVPHQFNPHWTFEATANNLLQIATGERKIIPRRQDLPASFYRDGSIYITKTDVIKQHSLYGNAIAFIENEPEGHVNIDTMSDWELAENLMQRKRQ